MRKNEADAVLFYGGSDIFSFLENMKANVAQMIESQDADYLLKVSEEDFIHHVVQTFQLNVPVLLENEIHSEDPRETMVDVSNNILYGSFGEHLEVPGSETTIVVPFEGEANFLKIQPSAYFSSPPRATVSGNELRFSFVQTGSDAGEIKREFDRQLKMTRESLQTLRSSVDQFYAQVPAIARDKFTRRKKRLLDSRGMVEALGYPVKRREGGSETYRVPVERKKVLAAPKVPPGKFKPEPRLEESVYQDILALIGDMAKVMEYSPAAFAQMGEEEIRFQFLVPLNGQFQGQATGETFNYEGKTDILIRSDGRNLFIAECKFWSGPKAFLETIDQLLGYLSWHDTKTAILIFNRNVNFTDVLESIVATVPKHPNFKRDEGKRSETSFRYVFGHPDDANRELIVTVMAFNIPAKA